MIVRAAAHCLCRAMELLMALATVQIAFYLASIMA
jgi:hypothetical protein